MAQEYCFPAQSNNWAERTLRTSDGFNLGAFCVIDTQPHVCTDAERVALTDLAASVIDLIELRLVHENLNCELSERAKTQEQIRSSEEKFRSVTQSVGDGIISSNKTGEIIFWNLGAEKIFGYREGRDARPTAEFDHAGAFSRDAYRGNGAAALRGGRSENPSISSRLES
jgi:PAS domain-containing protein